MTQADPAGKDLRQEIWPWLIVAAAWSPYLPLAWQYAAYLGCGLLAWPALRKAGRTNEALRHPLFVSALVFWGWLALSVAWTSAPPKDVAGHLWTYSLMLWVVPIALACTAERATRALRHFVAASTVVAAVILIDAGGVLPAALSWRPFVGVTGNQRIVFSLLLAVGAVLAVMMALDHGGKWRARFVAAALLCLTALALQDRRTGMLAAPLLLAVLAVARQRTWPRRAALVAAVLATAGVVWLVSPPVQHRFAEGVAELRAYRSEGEVASSWGMRARMLEVTAHMALERPLTGLGVGSWATEWRQRVHDGMPLESHSTPHNEYLLLAVQGGGVTLALGLWLWARVLRRLARRGPSAQAALLVLVAAAWAALFSAALRDAKFALPLLLLAALAWAASKPRAVQAMPGQQPTAAAALTESLEPARRVQAPNPMTGH